MTEHTPNAHEEPEAIERTRGGEPEAGGAETLRDAGAETSEQEAGETQAQQPAETPKKRPRKEDALKARIEELGKQLEEKQDRLLRLAAEFENYKRRTAREFSSIVKNASEAVITQLVPIVDDFERALDHARATDDFGSLHQGVEMILNHLRDVLKREGLEPIEAVGQPFDPNFHEALMQTEDEAFESGAVVGETQRGYVLNGKVIRPAQVIVNK